MATTRCAASVLRWVAQEIPASLVPGRLGIARHFYGKVHAGKAGPLPGPGGQRRDVEITVGIVADHPGRRAGVADAAGQRAGVDPGDPGKVMRHHPVLERGLAPPAGRGGRRLPCDHAKRGWRTCLVILGVGSDIADMREGEGDDLAGI